MSGPPKTLKNISDMNILDCVTLKQETPPDDLAKQLFNDSDFTDVTLVSKDGLQIPVHRAVLCAKSHFLRDAGLIFLHLVGSYCKVA